MNARNDVFSHFAADSEEVQRVAFCIAAKTSSPHSARFVPNQLTYSMVLCKNVFFMHDLPQLPPAQSRFGAIGCAALCKFSSVNL
jgi:hypothetical protein